MIYDSSWIRLGAVDAARLAEARLVAHWAVQPIAVAAGAVLKARPDDSHTNLRWRSEHGALVSEPLGWGAEVGLRLVDLALILIQRDTVVALPLAGRTLDDVLSWLGEALTASLARPPVVLQRPTTDLPAHPVADGAPFPEPDRAALAELARWYHDGTLVIGGRADARSSRVAIWPHHFDLGGVLFLEAGQPAESAHQIGYGLSPGDGHHAQPYVYVTPWPMAEDAALPALPAGAWQTEGFKGAVLTGDELVAAGGAEAQQALLERFLDAAFAAGEALIDQRTRAVGD